MSTGLLYALVGAVLYAAGVAGMLLHPDVLRKVIAFNVTGGGAFLVLVGLGQRGGLPDPVPQAMVLTGIVVSVAATALAVALARRLLNITGAMAPVAREDGDD